jgi:hypothetical protein
MYTKKLCDMSHSNKCSILLIVSLMMCFTDIAAATLAFISTTSTNNLILAGQLNNRSLFAYTDGHDGVPKGVASQPIQKHEPASISLKRSNVSTKNLPPSTLPNGGHVTMVGSGPGDPDLLTIAAHKILSDPNVLVISDRLVSKEILDIITGEIRVARKLPGCAEEAQEEIYKWVKEGLDSGKHVVRLKIGDPFVFGRGGEEVLKFREYGVEPKVIPVSLFCQSW